MKLIHNEKRSKIFYSNCLIEAIKAKIRDPKNVKILIVPKKLNRERTGRSSIGFHCFWKIGDLVYDFKCESNVKYFWQMLLFKGYIRANSYFYYDIMMHWDLEAYLRKLSKNYGKKLMFTDPYTTRDERLNSRHEPLMETIWNEVKENERIDPLFENEEVLVFYRDKRGKKCIKYATVHDGKVDIGNYKPLFIKMALWADPIEKIEDDEEETQENEQ